MRRRLRGLVATALVGSLIGPLVVATGSASAAGRTLAYDGLDRVVTVDGESVSYAGAASDPTAVGDWVFGRGPDGAVLSADDGTAASLVFPDRHGDASLMIDPSTAAVDASQVFDPFGQVAGAAGVSSPLGFQSDVTDAVTGDVWMGARWMSPSLGVFTSRDSYAGAVAAPATLNRYAYANGNPMSNWDPTGHSSESINKAEASQAGVEERAAQRELEERTAKGDVGVAQGRPLLGGPMELISAFKAPKSGGWEFVKAVITFAVSAVAGTVCGPVGVICASVAGRITGALLDGASFKEALKATFTWENLLRDGVIALVSFGAGAALGKLFDGAVSVAGRFTGTVVTGVVTGAVADFTATYMQTGSFSAAWDAATDLRARALDAGISSAAAFRQMRGGRSSRAPADEDGQPGNRPAKPDGPEADVTPAGEGSAARSCSINSFTGETLVLLADGRLVPIASVRVGDLVQATDPETGESGPRPVSKLIVHGGDHVMVDVVLADGSVISATDRHPFWSVDRGEFVYAVDLMVGERLLTASGLALTIAELRVSTYEVMAYNLTVDDIHTYYAGTTPILVHNSCDGDGEQLQLFDDTPYVAGGTATNTVKPMGELANPSFVNNAGSPIRSFVTEADTTYYRVYSGDRTVGGFLTGAPPASADDAVRGLALPPANRADFIQEVTVPAGTRLQSSIATRAFGQEGGMLQYELLDRIPTSNFGPGRAFR